MVLRTRVAKRVSTDRVQQAAYHELHRDPYRPEMEQEILDRVPPNLDALNESYSALETLEYI